ncbi:uncharacterized protein METZ01_LOCUS287182, partial [marine metagenome]
MFRRDFTKTTRSGGPSLHSSTDTNLHPQKNIA